MLNTVQKRVLAILLLLMIIITMFASYSRYVDSKNYNDFVLKRNNEKKQSFEKIVQLYNKVKDKVKFKSEFERKNKIYQRILGRGYTYSEIEKALKDII